MQKFKAILLKPHMGRERCTIVEVVAGGDGFDGRWRVLRPIDLMGLWLVPRIDADRAISMPEAAHIFSVRHGGGWHTRPEAVRRYIHKGTLAPAGRTAKDIGASNRAWFVSLEATWKMPFPKAGGYRPPKQQESDNDETEEAS